MTNELPDQDQTSTNLSSPDAVNSSEASQSEEKLKQTEQRKQPVEEKLEPAEKPFTNIEIY